MKSKHVKRLLSSAIAEVAGTPEDYCVNPNCDFTRTRKIPLQKLISGIINIGQSNNNVNIHEDENNHFEFSENGDNGFEYSTGEVIITLPGIEASISGNVLLPNSIFGFNFILFL